MVTVLQWKSGEWVVVDTVVVDHLSSVVRYLADWIAVPAGDAVGLCRTLNRAMDCVECHEGGE